VPEADSDNIAAILVVRKISLNELKQHNPESTMKKTVLLSLVIATASVVQAANVPDGLTGLWRFQDTANYGAATIGNDITFNVAYGGLLPGPWTVMGTAASPGVYNDGSVFQEQSWNYMSVNPAFTANGGGSYVNQYTVLIDYRQTQAGWNSLFQTAWDGNANDGDLWMAPDGTIGVGDTGYSTLTLNPDAWHRIVWSVNNGNWFRVYVDGALYLDGTPQEVDGRFSLYTDRFNLFADDSWEDMWGLVGTVATWDHALTTADAANMGGWIGGAETPTPLLVPEPAAISLMALGALALLRRKRR
jgi:hypothetical protein